MFLRDQNFEKVWIQKGEWKLEAAVTCGGMAISWWPSLGFNGSCRHHGQEGWGGDWEILTWSQDHQRVIPWRTEPEKKSLPLWGALWVQKERKVSPENFWWWAKIHTTWLALQASNLFHVTTDWDYPPPPTHLIETNTIPQRMITDKVLRTMS